MSPDEFHLLIVDDHPDNIRVLASLLGSSGFGLSFAEDGYQALEYLRHEPCDLVLMDIMMPGLSGIEVCALMQADPQLSRIPVIFITALHDYEALIQAFEAGGVDYLTKPFISQELVARIQIHLRLRASEHRLRKLLAMRELMIATLSHDLRGPIGTMASMLDLVLKGPMSPERTEKMLQNLASSARRSYELLEDLLTWSRAVTDELPFNPVPMSLRALCQECINFQSTQAEEKGLDLSLEIAAEIRCWVDGNLVRTILLNLLANAVKFTPPAGQIIVRCELTPGQVVLQVIDSGKGIPANLTEQLERNQPISSLPGTQGEKGTGMGLKICQEFAARHGGRLEMRKLPGQGSCFSLVLPQSEDLKELSNS